MATGTAADTLLTPARVHNSAMKAHALITALALLCSACAQTPARTDAMTASAATPLRLATYNTSLYSDQTGGLIKELEGDSEHARKIAAVLNRFGVARLMELNGFRLEADPELQPEDVRESTLADLAEPLSKLAQGTLITPGEDIERYLRNLARLPELPEQPEPEPPPLEKARRSYHSEAQYGMVDVMGKAVR